jgi:RND superfamily putative drug exporter
MSGFLYRLGRRCATHGWRVLIVWVLIAAAVVGAKNMFGGSFHDKFRTPGAESQRANDRLDARFAARSGATGRVVFHTDIGRLADPGPQATIAAARARIAAGPHVATIDPTVESADHRIAFMDVHYTIKVLKRPEYDAALAGATEARARGVDAELTGSIANAVRKIDGNEAFGLIVALIVLVIAFGSLIAAGVPIGTALIGVMIGLSGVGILAGFHDVPSVSPLIATMIGVGVGIDYSLFVVTRHRQHLADGMNVVDAAATANATAGQAVLFAGTTVVIAILGLQLAGLPAVTLLGFSTAIVVIIAMSVAVTLLPAILGLLGRRIDKLAVHRTRDAEHPRETLSGRWAHHVGSHPWQYMIVSLLVLLALAVPVLSLHIGVADDGNAAKSTTQRHAYDMLGRGFGPGFNGPFNIVVEAPAGQARAATARIADTLKHDPELAAVVPQAVNPAGDTAVLLAMPRTSPQDAATGRTLRHLRSMWLPEATAGASAKALVTGEAAINEDISTRITDRLPWFIGAVVLLSFLLLMIVFRSVFVPLKAALMNLLSIGASYGVIVAVFQWGWGKGLVGLDSTIPVNPFVPMMMFAILFGLSMDYEVFLLSRVREDYVNTGDGHGSVVTGLASTARVITSAALIMISVFAGFIGSSDVTVKMFGLGLATAVFVDATLVRMVLVPSTMELLGSANWWVPKWLDRILPHLDLEGTEIGETDDDTERVPVAA